LIPIISQLHNISITYGLAASGGIILLYSIASFLFGRKFVFGNDYLRKTIETDEIVKIGESDAQNKKEATQCC
jgi:hypothetical protein